MINVVPGLLVVAVFVLIAVAGLTLVQCIVPSQLRQQHNYVAGFIYAVVGVICAVDDSACGYRCLGGLRCGKGHGGKGS
jgi:hypothetical protein